MNRKASAELRGEQTVVSNQWLVIGASSLGTVFEWYDFYLYGLLANYAAIGVTAPVALVLLRLLQGPALGGEYGGAATYVAEHAPPGKRGVYTSRIQTTATLIVGLLFLPETFNRQIEH